MNIIIWYWPGKLVKWMSTGAVVKMKGLISRFKVSTQLSKILNQPLELNNKGFIRLPALLWNKLNDEIRKIYSNISWVDDILDISKGYQIWKIWGWWTAINVPLTWKSADIIWEILEEKGWKKTIVIDEKTWNSVWNYISPNGLEKINIRAHSSSWGDYLANWYKVEKTIDLLKWN